MVFHDCETVFSESVRSLRKFLDESLSKEIHVNQLCKVLYFHVANTLASFYPVLILVRGRLCSMRARQIVEQSGKGYMQLCANSVQDWVSENGFKFFTSKTVCLLVFVFLGKTPIKVVKEAKFLGLIFDIKLTFKNHVQYLKTSCQKALDILRVVGHTDWGADRIVLLRLYRAPNWITDALCTDRPVGRF